MATTRALLADVVRTLRTTARLARPRPPESDKKEHLRASLREFREWSDRVTGVFDSLPDIDEEDDEEGQELLEIRERVTALETRVQQLASLRSGPTSEHIDRWNATLLASDDALPVGLIGMWGTTTAPSKWLVLDGSEVSQTTYAELYALWGTTFNTGGEAAGNFRLPDFRGRVPVGYGATAPQNAIGNSDGLAENARDISSHAHTFTSDAMDISHTHDGTTNGPSDVVGTTGSDFAAGGENHTHTFTTGGMSANDSPVAEGTTDGAGGAPYLVVNFIVYAGVAA